LLLSATASEHSSEEIAEIRATSPSFSEAFLSILIIHFPLLRIREDLVSSVKILKFLNIASFVGMHD